MSFGYGPTPAVRDVSFAVPGGQFFTLLGPSGCGKTTLLKLIGGYLAPAAGRVTIRGRDVTGEPPERRNAGMVFQSYALFPHLPARRNVSFGLEVRGVPAEECRARADAMLDRVGLTPAERDRRPAALSGGQQQRVALARALVVRPDLLLLDEPFANLDRRLREQLRDELRRLHRETGVTTVMATHDQDEALVVSDRVGVLRAGRLLQVGPPREVYDRPRTRFVAEFLGDANLLDGATVGGPAGSVVMVRPERLVVGPEAGRCRWAWPGRVKHHTFQGADVVGEFVCDSGLTLRFRTRHPVAVGPGAVAVVGFPDGAAWPIPEPDDEP